MKEITAYICADGRLFTNEKKAIDYDEDLLGQEIDGLLRIYKLDLSRNQEFKGCLNALKDKKELKKAVSAILQILNHAEEMEN